MKTNFKSTKLLAVILLFLLGMSTGNHLLAQKGTEKNTSNKATPAKPDDGVLLHLCDFVVQSTEADDGNKNAYAWLKVGAALEDLDWLEETISKRQLDSLQQVVEAKHQSEHGCTEFVTGLQAYFGLQGKTIKLLYKPMYMCRKGATQDFNVTQMISGYYVYKPNVSFTTATVAEESQLNAYKQNIRFRESTAQTRTFVVAEDNTGDARAVLMPFQEINAVMRHNSSDCLKIWNFAFRNAQANNRIRQTLLLGPEGMTPEHFKNVREKGITKPLFMLGFQGAFADRSHLCPPSCNVMTLKVSGVVDNCQNP